MSSLRSLLRDPRTVDSVVVVLATWFVLGAYVTAFSYVHENGVVLEPAQRAGFTTVTASWALLTLFLFAGFAVGLREGKPWNRALPDGQTGTFAAALVFGSAWIVDQAFWSVAFGTQSTGLDSLFTPPHLIEMGAAAVIVSGPLRAAARRGETVAGPVTLTSAALLLSVLTFATQFVHPLIDPWAMRAYEYRDTAPAWLGQNVGMAALLAQTVILAGTGLLLNSAFKVRPGSLTFVFGINGVLVCITKLHFQLVAVPILCGVAADAWIAWTARRPGKPSASLCALIGGTYAIVYMTEISLLPGGSAWGPSLWAGAIIACVMVCWLMGRLLRAGLPGAIFEPYPLFMSAESVPAAERWTLDPDSDAREHLVHAALDDLGTPEALGRSPLAQLPGLSKDGSAAAELRALLVEVITDLAGAAPPRDAESGRLLLDYYVKRVGSHEVIMERLHLSRPTYYRRLRHGFELVANRLDELSVGGARVPAS